MASVSVCGIGDTCPRALAGRGKNVEFIPKGHRELLKVFRQTSVRIKKAFLKARPSCTGSRTRREKNYLGGWNYQREGRAGHPSWGGRRPGRDRVRNDC